MQVRAPTAAERRWRLWRLGVTRRLAPVLGIDGGRWLRSQVLQRLEAPNDDGGFFVPLPWVETVWGALPERRIGADAIDTILADWVDCGGRMRMTIDYFLGGGDWSALVRTTAGDPVRKEARQLHAAGLEYTRTQAYGALVASVAGAQTPPQRQGRLLHSSRDVDAYFQRFVRLFRSIEHHGLLSQAELRSRGIRFNDDRGLGVAVDRDGRLHRLQGGNHRWAIAQVLGVEKVPVEVRLVHVAGVPPDVAECLGLPR